jgi:hypothetical protein
VQERRQIYTRSWNEYLKEETSLGRPRLRWEDNIIMDLKKKGRKICTGFIWLRIGKTFQLF